MKNKNHPLDKTGMHAGASPRIFENAERLRVNQTPAESKLWKYLRTKPYGYKFRRQHPIGKYILDFYCHKFLIKINDKL